jgi:hypothetical protein
MSSRALRRAQRELEEKQIQEKLAQDDQDEEESETEAAPKTKAKPSLFAMLGDGGNQDEDDEEEGTDQDVAPKAENSDGSAEAEPTPALKPSKKSKKKKKKARAKGKAADADRSSASAAGKSDLDEIDQALLALNLAMNGQTGTGSDQQDAVTEEKKQLFSVLSVDTQHLHAANEMKKLFGRAAVQSAEDEARPRQRGQQGGIAAAIAGRNAPGNRNLASLGLRRNIFIQGKEEWPRATSGGLGMEVVEKRPDGTVEYRFVHNRMYQDVQRQFQICVASMDSERMIQLLHHNRKLGHISYHPGR